jgi:putative ABC transport system permease protein
VGDVRNPTAADVQPTAYRPYAQSPATAAVLMIRTAIEADLVTDTVRRTLTDILRGSAPVRVNNLERGVSAYITPQRFTTSMVGFFAVLGLLLAGLGVYAVMRNWVSVRTFEFGVRMALGAQRGDIARLVLRSAGTTAAIGVALGIAGALALQRIVASQLYGVSPTDPAVFAGVSLFMAVVALTAGFLPARSAMRVDAAAALRQE